MVGRFPHTSKLAPTSPRGAGSPSQSSTASEATLSITPSTTLAATGGDWMRMAAGGYWRPDVLVQAHLPSGRSVTVGVVDLDRGSSQIDRILAPFGGHCVYRLGEQAAVE